MNNITDIPSGTDRPDDERSPLQRPAGSSHEVDAEAVAAATGRRRRRPYRVCFVCTGNICRSPMAEWVLRAQIGHAGLAESVEVDSAGTGGWHVGEPADPRTVQVLARHGYPSHHVARQFQPSDLLSRDLVIALDAGHLRTLRRLADSLPDLSRASLGRASLGRASLGQPEEGDADRRPAVARLRLLREFDPAADPGRSDVPDPYYGSLAGFEECLAMVQDAMPGLLSYLGKALETRAG